MIARDNLLASYFITFIRGSYLPLGAICSLIIFGDIFNIVFVSFVLLGISASIIILLTRLDGASIKKFLSIERDLFSLMLTYLVVWVTFQMPRIVHFEGFDVVLFVQSTIPALLIFTLVESRGGYIFNDILKDRSKFITEIIIISLIYLLGGSLVMGGLTLFLDKFIVFDTTLACFYLGISFFVSVLFQVVRDFYSRTNETETFKNFLFPILLISITCYFALIQEIISFFIPIIIMFAAVTVFCFVKRTN